MVWIPSGELAVDFNEQFFPAAFVGDQLIKVEHGFTGNDFPGIGYAILSNLYFGGERDWFRRSYPFKNSARIYHIISPPQLQAENYQIYQIAIRRSLRARVDADANWRVRIFRWGDASELGAQ